MFGRILPVIRKEFIQIIRDPRTLAIVLLMPPMQIVLLGYAVNSDVKHIRTVVVDEARDETSRAIIHAFSSTEYFDIVDYVNGPRVARNVIDRGQAKVAFIIPPTFGADLKANRPTAMQVIIDGSDPSIAQTALFAANAIAQAKASELLATTINQAGASGRLEMPLELRPDVLYNPDMRSINFMIPGLIGMILQFQSLVLTAFAIVRERERGTLEQLIMTPIRPWELTFGKIAPYVIIAFWNVGIACALGLLWFQVKFAGSFFLLLALSVLFLIGSLGLGMLISTTSRTQTQAMQTAVFAMLPTMLLTGLIFPLENLPRALYILSYFWPLTYFLRILRGIALKGLGIDYLWNEVLLLAAFGIIVFAVSANRFRKKLA